MFPVQPTSPKNQIQHWIYWRRMSEMQNTVKNIFFQKIYIEDCSYCKKTKKISTCSHSPSCMHQRILNKKCYLGKWCCNITGNLDRYSNYCNKYKQIWQILHLNSGAGIFDLVIYLFWKDTYCGDTLFFRLSALTLQHLNVRIYRPIVQITVQSFRVYCSAVLGFLYRRSVIPLLYVLLHSQFFPMYSFSTVMLFFQCSA